MKSKITLALALIIATFSFAQQGINYKAVIKNNLGNVFANQVVTVQFSILRGVGQSNVYTENQTATTDANGILIVNIGEGTPLNGTFAAIDWGSDTHYLNVKINIGNGLVNMGTTPFMAVPYALYAKTTEGAVKKIDDLEDGKTEPNGSSIYIGLESGLNHNGKDSRNVALGYQALRSISQGTNNTAVGSASLFSNTYGVWNTAVGTFALYTNQGNMNTALGHSALKNNTNGNSNTASGEGAMLSNTTGSSNTANGKSSLKYNTTGSFNTAVGNEALFFSARGSYNTATGKEALYHNYEGSWNTASGYRALRANTTGSFNTANGRDALYSNTTGKLNTAIGYQALYYNTIGENNTAIGDFSGSQIYSGSNNTAVGFMAQVPRGDGNNQVQIGNDQISYAGIHVAWTITSDRRLKNNIQSSSLGLNFINALKPVVYKRNNDESKKTEYGFIAQEVEAILKQFGTTDNGIITIDDKGMYSLRYNDLIAILTKAMQEQQEVIKSIQSTVGSQQSIIKGQDIKIDGLTSELEQNKQTIKAFDARLEQLESKLKTIY